MRASEGSERMGRERFVTEQATYTLAGPPELRWGNLRWGGKACVREHRCQADNRQRVVFIDCGTS